MPSSGATNLNMGFEIGDHLALGESPISGGTLNNGFNGPNLKVVDASVLAAFGITLPPGWTKWGKFTLGPGQNVPNGRYIISAQGRDPNEPGVGNEAPANTPEYYFGGNAWHYSGQDMTYVGAWMMPSRPYDLTSPYPDPANNSTRIGSFDPNNLDNDGKPLPLLQSPKLGEITHADKFIDGAVSGYDGLAGTLPQYPTGLHGHNAMGVQSVFNRVGLFQQFGVRPWTNKVPWNGPNPSGVTPQSTDWTAPNFKPAFVADGSGNAAAGTDCRAYWGFASGVGDISSHDNTDFWALKPVVPDEVVWFVIRMFKSDDVNGRIQIWVSTNPATLTTATPPLVDYTGSTNQYAAGTAIFDPTQPNSHGGVSAGGQATGDIPQRLMQHPNFALPAMVYNGDVNPSATFLSYCTSFRRRTSVALAMAEINGGTPSTAPQNTSPPTIAGSALQGATLTGSVGGWVGTPTPTLAYQWLRDGANISGATSQTYVLQAADVGHQVAFMVTGTNGVGAGVSATSSSVGPVQAPGTVSVVHQATTPYVVFGTVDSRQFTVPSIANRLMLIQIAGKTGSDSFAPTVNGVGATLVAQRNQGSVRAELWAYIAPPTGAVTVAWTKTGSGQNIAWAVSVYSGVNQSTPYEDIGQAGVTQDSGGAKLLALASSANDLIHAMAVFNGGTTSSGPSAGGSLASVWSTNQSTTQGAGAWVAGASSVTVSFTPSGSPNFDWAILGVSLISLPAAVMAPTNEQLPSIAGMTQENQILAGSAGLFDEHGDTTTYAFQYIRCDSSGLSPSNISGATSLNYTLQTADVGHTIRLAVTATNSGGSTTATSAQTAVVTAAPVAPTNSVLPSFEGNPQQGELLAEISLGVWNGATTLTQQWMRCDPTGANGVAIQGATGKSYVPQASDVGGTLRLRVTAANVAGSAFADSPQSTVVTAASGVTRPSLAGYALAKTNGATSLSFPVQIQQDARILVVRCSDAYVPDINTITATGSGSPVALAPKLAELDNSGAAGITVYWLALPPIGNVTINITLNSTRTMIAEAIAVKDCSTSDPFGTFAVRVGTSTTPSLSCESGPDDLAFGFLTFKDSPSTDAPVDDPLQVQLGTDEVDASSFSTRAVSSTRHSVVGLTSMTWTIDRAPVAGWTVCAFSVKAVPASNSAPPIPIFAPLIAGTDRVGQMLTLVNNGQWNNVDSNTLYPVQWVRDTAGDGVYVNVIAGATASTYTLQADDAGCNVVAVVTATTASGSAVSQSNPIGPIAVLFAVSLITNFNYPPQNPLSEGGRFTGPMQPGAGQLLTVNPSGTDGTATGDGIHDCQSYLVGHLETNPDKMVQLLNLPANPGEGVGVWGRIQSPNTSSMCAYIGVYIKGTGYQIYKVTNATIFDLISSTNARVAIIDEYLRLAISGTTMTLYHGVDNGDGTFSWGVACTASDSDITGPGTIGLEASGSTVRFDNWSEAVESVAPTNDAVPDIFGDPVFGGTLTGSTGVWEGDPTSFGFQWNRSSVAISGAIGQTYEIQDADVGHELTVTVTAENGLGSASATSAPTASIIGTAATVRVGTVDLAGHLAALVSVFPAYAAPADADDLYIGALPFAEAQARLGQHGNDGIDPVVASVGWHGTITDPDRGSFAIVQTGGRLAGLLGSRVKITVGGESVFALVKSEADVLQDITVTRRLFQQLGILSDTEVQATVSEVPRS